MLGSRGEVRKIQVTGGSTYIISLPKWWVRSAKLKQGDQLEFVLQDDFSLLIVPKGTAKKEEKVSFITTFPMERAEDVGRRFIADYLAGYDIIHVRFAGDSANIRSHIKDLIRRKLVGVEVIEESSEHLIGQCLLGHVEFPLRTAISRMYVLSMLMNKDVMKALKDQNFALAEDILQRDDDVDRLYFFVVRQLKTAIVSRPLIEKMGLKGPQDCLGYRLVAKSLERIADHAVRIAEAVRTMKSPIPEELLEFMTELSAVATNVCENAMRALSKVDVNMAQKAISLAKEMGKFEEKFVRRMLDFKMDTRSVMGLRLIMESVRRVAEYGADIAEIAINLASEIKHES